MFVMDSVFFNGEDGIRDAAVTGVETCALQIWCAARGCSRFCRRSKLPTKPTTRAPGRARPGALRYGAAGATRRVQIGRASCRERGEISVVAVSLKKKRGRALAWQSWVGEQATS